VFVVVGLAAASIVLFIFFWLRRRRMKQRQREASIAAGLAALGHNRSLIDDDDENPPPVLPGMVQHNHDSLSFSSRGEEQDFNPYVGYTYGTSRPYAGSLRPGQPYNPAGYQIAPTRESDPSHAQQGHTPALSFGTVSSNNVGSAGPPTPNPGLNGAHQRTASTTPLITQIAGLGNSDQPPSPGSHYSDGEGEEKESETPHKSGLTDPRLNAALLTRTDSQGGASLGDHVDYTRPLTVRNE